MASMTGGTAVAERPTEMVWPPMMHTSRGSLRARPPLPATDYLHHVPRVAEGVVADLPGAVTDLTVSRDGRHLVAAHYGQDAVSIIDTATLTVTDIVGDVPEPYAVATADLVFVRSASTSADMVVALDPDSGCRLASREIGVDAEGLAVSPAGDVLYVARNFDGAVDVAVVDVESGRIGTIAVPAGIAIDTLRINRAGTRLYAALTTLTGAVLLMIDIRTGRLRTVPVGDSIGDLAVDAADQRVVLTGWDPALGAVLRIVDTLSARLIQTIPVGGMPVSVLSTGATVLLTDGDNVVVVDPSTARIVNRIDIGRPVSCLAASRDGSRLYVGDFHGNVEALSMQSLHIPS